MGIHEIEGKQNHNHQLNWWYAQALKGPRTCKRLKTRRIDCQPHLYSQAAPKGAFLLPTYSCYPWTGLCILSAISDHWQCLPEAGSLCIPVSLFCFVPQCQHSSPCTRNACCHTCISYLHAGQKSRANFCPLYPMIWATLYFGGMLINMWIWSGHNSASIISIPFWSHSCLMIFPMSPLIFP